MQPSSYPGYQPEGAQRHNWNNHKNDVNNTRSSHAKEILCKLSTIWQAPSRISPAAYQAQKFKEYQFQGVPKY
jgi:hypothetical protein